MPGSPDQGSVQVDVQIGKVKITEKISATYLGLGVDQRIKWKINSQ